MSPPPTFQTPTDTTFYTKLNESIRRIFSTQKQEWTCEQIIRFLTLIKVESKLESIFYEFKISGELLFDIRYLWSHMAGYLENRTYFPIMKLMYVVERLNVMESREHGQQHNVAGKTVASSSSGGVKFVRSTSGNSSSGGGNENSRSKAVEKQGKTKTQHNNSNESRFGKFQFKCDKTPTVEVLTANERKSQKEIFDQQQTEEQFLDIKLTYVNAQGDILRALEKEFKKLGEAMIADLSCNQLARIFKSTENQRAIELAELIRKYSLDGYSIVCLLADRSNLLEEIVSFFTVEEISEFEEVLNLILPFYYKQIYENQQRQANKFSIPQLSGLNLGFLSQKSDMKTAEDLAASNVNVKESFGRSEFDTSQMGTSQMGTSQMGTSQICGESQAGSVDASVYGTSEYDTGNSYGRKQSMGRSEYGNSVYDKSQLGNSEYAASEYAMSQRGSIRESEAGSMIGQSMVFYGDEHKQKKRDVRISSVQDIDIIQRLKSVALSLPFNLFKMDPLQNIKVTTLNYPFNISFAKSKSHEEFVRNLKQNLQKLKQCSSNSSVCSRDFNITGVKFGRSQENDYRYPDELSISAKHAQIGFWDNKYQLVDLQSKTGTFLYIPMTRPLILKDEHIIQLSNEIEIIVHILKKEANEGTIKLEFTKPQNEPFYKATLKQNQTLKIGRSQKSHIKLSQQSISSKHTEIKYENKEFKLYDCLSSTGTWLRLSKKGVKSEMFPIQEGDIIRISSKKTYMIEKMTNSLLQDDDDQFDEMYELLENPNFKLIREGSDDNFDKIIENTMKRKTPYEKKREVHFQDQFGEFKE